MHRLKLYGLLVGLMITILLICDVLAFKIVSIGGHDLVASGIIFPFSFLFSSIITDVYGFKLAGRIIWIQLTCSALFILTINLFVFLPSPESANTATHYFAVFHNLWHVLIASSIAVTSAYFINDVVMSKLKIYMSGRYFIIRFLISNAIGKAILVFISYPINFYGQYTAHYIVKIAINTWTYKMVIAILLFPVAILLSNIIKRIEKLDYFDYGVPYNPLTVFNEDAIGENKYDKISQIKRQYRESYSA
ncbi:MAG: VUT family protein [Gammaproteobacteria bacterium]|nr:MAG: VUT family protein [Gammaproteobacteria bacterium]